MECPYKTSRIKHIEQTENLLIDEETGVTKGVCVTFIEDHKYCDCIEEECAVYYDGKCHYNG